MSKPAIHLRGVRVHNLRDIDLDIPRGELVVVCGVSGSGKTSLALDTLYAEGQRRYIESFSPYTRQFLEQLDKPDADRIEGIPPAIAVTRSVPQASSRATVGSATETLDYMRLLWARVSKLFCHQCGQAIEQDSPESIVRVLLDLPDQNRFLITVPFSVASDMELESTLEELRARGFVRGLWQSEFVDLSSPLKFSGASADLMVVVDRLVGGQTSAERLTDSIESAYELGGGSCRILIEGDASSLGSSEDIAGRKWARYDYSRQLRCVPCDVEYPEPEPRLFSYNSPLGACPTCEGFGSIQVRDMDLIVPDPSKSLRDGAIAPWNTPAYSHELQELLALAPHYDIPTEVPFRKLSPKHLELITQGIPEEDFGGLDGFFKWLERRKYKMHLRVFYNRWHSYLECPDCNGDRLNPIPLAWKIEGNNIATVCQWTIEQARQWFDDLHLSDDQAAIAQGLLGEIRSRLGYLAGVGLGYLALQRPLRTLSRGEAQRVALTTALGSTLVNMMYVLDEPTSGMHPSDVERLSGCIQGLRQRDNTVVCVEHDEVMIRKADELIEIGPGAGDYGGQLTFQGNFDEMLESEESITAPFFTGQRGVLTESKRRPPNRGKIKLVGASGNNLKDVTVEFPLGLLCVVTGVSGAGKSSLVQETLYGAICRRKRKESARPLPYVDLLGDGQIDDVIMVDQTPIGKSPRSNPVTYVKAFDEIRSVFASTIEAKTHNYTASHFSFNVDGGRCERCKGDGVLSIDMQFMADVYVKCPECHGQRYRKEVLAVLYRGKSISDVLGMSVRQAFSFFRGQVKVQSRLKPLMDVGLDYLRLGQSAITLSSGEAQRLKLASYTTQLKRHRTLFILEEPTAGLHFADVIQLIDSFDALISVGHSVVVVDHNPRLMKAADYIIDIGPGAGEQGGNVVAQGSPEEVAGCEDSVTGRYLRSLLAESADAD